jgi:O-antigen/teichoic acid export membrane protein
VSDENMDKAVKMGKTSATGSFQLFIGKIASTVMLAVGTIIVGIFIDDWALGLYTIAMIPSVTFLLFQDWGVGSALTKYCANYRAKQMQGELKQIVLSGLAFETVTGFILTIFSLITANFMASTIFGKPESAFLISISSITVLSAAIYSFSMSVFVGFERMKLATIAMIISATVQGFLSPLLVYLGFGAAGAVVGYVVSSIASGIASLALLYLVIIRQLPSESAKKINVLQTLKPLLHYGVPIALATIIGGLSPQLISFMMASFVDEAIIGNYKIALNFSIFLTFFIYPVQTVLFPVFSKLNPSNEKTLLKTVFESSVKYLSMLLVPATIALMVLSTPIISTIYGGKWPFAPFFLTLNVIGNLFVLLGSLIYIQLLYATGETKMVMKLNILATCISIPLAVLLIPSFGVVGVILSGFGGIPSMLLGVYWTWKHFEAKADSFNSARIFFASLIAGITTYLFQTAFFAAPWIMLTAGVVLFLVVYLITAPLVGAINQIDINNLRLMLSGLGIISKILEIPLMLIEKILGYRNKKARGVH